MLAILFYGIQFSRMSSSNLIVIIFSSGSMFTVTKIVVEAFLRASQYPDIAKYSNEFKTENRSGLGPDMGSILMRHDC